MRDKELQLKKLQPRRLKEFELHRRKLQQRRQNVSV
jgi:hypothetical protein